MLSTRKNTSTAGRGKKKEIVFLLDGTASMGAILQLICIAICEVLGIAALCGVEVRLAYYRDYDVDRVRGGYVITPAGASYDEMRLFVDLNKQARGGHGDPESQQSAFEELLRGDAAGVDDDRLIVHCTDAPPHGGVSGCEPLDQEGVWEKAVFEAKGWAHCDWSGLSARMKKAATVITFSFDQSYEAMGINLGRDEKGEKVIGSLQSAYPTPYPNPQEVVDLLCTWLGAEPSAGSAPRLARVPSLVPAVDVLHTIKNMDTQKLIAILRNVIMHCPESLRTNPTFGQVWRFVCAMRRDVEVREQVQELADLLSKAIAELPRGPRAEMMKWIDHSYDNGKEIQERVSAVWQAGAQMLYIQAPHEVARDAAMDLLRKCTFAPSISETIQSCEPGTISGPSPVQGGTLRCLPLALGAQGIFELLISLVCSGTLFSLRGSLIVAIMSHRSVALAALAEQHLVTNIGWVDLSLGEAGTPTVPENFAPDFIGALCTVDPERRIPLLGPETAERLRCFELLTQLKQNLTATVVCIVQCEPSAAWKTRAVPDHKFHCAVCGNFRSKTNRVVKDPAQCGLCYYVTSGAAAGDFTIQDVKECREEEDKSVMPRCGSCNCWYAVSFVQDLVGSAKCHDCRVRKDVRYRNSCVLCHRAFVSPTATGVRHDYTCAVCSLDATGACTEQEFTVATIMQEAPKLWTMFGLSPAAGHTLHKMKILQMLHTPVGSGGILETATVTVKGVEVHNPPAVVAQVREVLLGGTGEGRCACCYSIVPYSQIDSMCGNTACDVRACDSCIETWYGHSQAGSVVYPAHFHCPYCKQKPCGDTLRKHGGHRGLQGYTQFDWCRAEREFILWCATCGQLKTFCPRGECGDDAPAPAVTGRSCTKCQEAAVGAAAERVCVVEAEHEVEQGGDTRLCPKHCGALIFKDGGCDHVSCPCGAHICWTCMAFFESSKECYQHIWAAAQCSPYRV